MQINLNLLKNLVRRNDYFFFKIILVISLWDKIRIGIEQRPVPQVV